MNFSNGDCTYRKKTKFKLRIRALQKNYWRRMVKEKYIDCNHQFNFLFFLKKTEKKFPILDDILEKWVRCVLVLRATLDLLLFSISPFTLTKVESWLFLIAIYFANNMTVLHKLSAFKTSLCLYLSKK